MEDSTEPSHWVSPALISSDPLASLSEPGLLPTGEEGESFFSNPDTDYSSLSYFSPPNLSRAPAAYRHSSGSFDFLSVLNMFIHPCFIFFVIFIYFCCCEGSCYYIGNSICTFFVLFSYSSSSVYLTLSPK